MWQSLLQYAPMAISAAGSLGSMFGGSGGSDSNSDNTAAMLSAIMGKREYKLDEKAMKRVVDQLNQMRATGQNITPEMYDSLYRAELQTASDVALKKAETGANVGLRASALGEQSRQFDDRLAAEGQAGMGDLAGKLSTMLLAKGKTGTGTPSGGTDLASLGYSNPDATSSCILVTACHGSDSEEVNIAREYRDRFMDSETIRGYYLVSEFVLPAMQVSKQFTKMVKYALVDSLIDYGKYILGITPYCSDQSKEDTLGFLGVCKDIGHSIPKLIRSNGEVV